MCRSVHECIIGGASAAHLRRLMSPDAVGAEMVVE